MQDDSPVLVPLTRGGVAIVEWRDWQRVTARRWSMTPTQVYPCGGGVTLHRFIMRATHGEEVAHLNGDVLDCRRANLRLLSHRQNMNQLHRRRRGPFIGVSGPLNSRYQALVHGVYYYGGPCQLDAVLVRDHAIRCLFGCASTYNLPRPGELPYDPYAHRTPPREDAVLDPFAKLALRARHAAALWMGHRAWACATVANASAVTNLSSQPLTVHGCALEPANTLIRCSDGDTLFRGAAEIGFRAPRTSIRFAREAMIRLLEVPWELWLDKGPRAGGPVIVGHLTSSDAPTPHSAHHAAPPPCPAISPDTPTPGPLVRKPRTPRTIAMPPQEAPTRPKTPKIDSKPTQASLDTPEAARIGSSPTHTSPNCPETARRFINAISDAEPTLRLQRWPWIQPLLDDVIAHLTLVEQAESVTFPQDTPDDPNAALARIHTLTKLRKRLRKSLMDLQTACLNTLFTHSDAPTLPHRPKEVP